MKYEGLAHGDHGEVGQTTELINKRVQHRSKTHKRCISNSAHETVNVPEAKDLPRCNLKARESWAGEARNEINIVVVKVESSSVLHCS